MGEKSEWKETLKKQRNTSVREVQLRERGGKIRYPGIIEFYKRWDQIIEFQQWSTRLFMFIVKAKLMDAFLLDFGNKIRKRNPVFIWESIDNA